MLSQGDFQTPIFWVFTPCRLMKRVCFDVSEKSAASHFTPIAFGGKCCFFLQYDYTTFMRDSKTLVYVGFHSNKTKNFEDLRLHASIEPPKQQTFTVSVLIFYDFMSWLINSHRVTLKAYSACRWRDAPRRSNATESIWTCFATTVNCLLLRQIQHKLSVHNWYKLELSLW